MSVLVTGGSGLIGKYLQQICPDWIYVSSKDFNLLSQRDANLLVKQERPDHIIHLAAKVGGILSNEKYPCDYFEENMLMGLNIVRAARINEVKRFTGVLSTCAYPDTIGDGHPSYSPYPLSESMLHEGPPSNSNFGYGIAKRALATHIDTCNKQYETRYNYIIPCNLYGAYDDYSHEHSHYVAALIRKIYQAEISGSEEIELFGTGNPLRQFMHGADIARVIKCMVGANVTASFNVATPEVKSIKDIALIALKALGKEHYKIKFNGSFPDGQYRKDVSIDKFSKYLPYFEFTSLSDGILKTYQHYKESKNNQ